VCACTYDKDLMYRDIDDDKLVNLFDSIIIKNIDQEDVLVSW